MTAPGFLTRVAPRWEPLITRDLEIAEGERVELQLPRVYAGPRLLACVSGDAEASIRAVDPAGAERPFTINTKYWYEPVLCTWFNAHIAPVASVALTANRAGRLRVELYALTYDVVVASGPPGAYRAAHNARLRVDEVGVFDVPAEDGALVACIKPPAADLAPSDALTYAVIVEPVDRDSCRVRFSFVCISEPRMMRTHPARVAPHAEPMPWFSAAGVASAGEECRVRVKRAAYVTETVVG